MRSKTISKHFWDDEILFRDPVTKELHLKEGVKRMDYYGSINYDDFDQINYELLTSKKIKDKLEELEYLTTKFNDDIEE